MFPNKTRNAEEMLTKGLWILKVLIIHEYLILSAVKLTSYNDKTTTYNDESTAYKDESTAYDYKSTMNNDENTAYNIESTAYHYKDRFHVTSRFLKSKTKEPSKFLSS